MNLPSRVSSKRQIVGDDKWETAASRCWSPKRQGVGLRVSGGMRAAPVLGNLSLVEVRLCCSTADPVARACLHELDFLTAKPEAAALAIPRGWYPSFAQYLHVGRIHF